MQQGTMFDKALHQTYTWLHEVSEEVGWGDRQRAYHALRAVLLALRDRLTVEETAQLSAQLPLLVRGIFFEGWQPSKQPLKIRTRQEFLALVQDHYLLDGVSPEVMTRAVFRVLSRHITSGEVQDVRRMLPHEIRALWPEPGETPENK